MLFNLLNNSFYRKLYTAHIRTVLNESLDTSVIRNEINHLQQLGYSSADNDQNKGFSIQDYFSNVESALWTGWGFGGIMSSIDARKEYLYNHPEVSLVPPILYGLNVSNNIITVNEVFTVHGKAISERRQPVGHNVNIRYAGVGFKQGS